MHVHARQCLAFTRRVHNHVQYISRVFESARRRIVPRIAWARKIFRRLRTEQAQRGRPAIHVRNVGVCTTAHHLRGFLPQMRLQQRIRIMGALVYIHRNCVPFLIEFIHCARSLLRCESPHHILGAHNAQFTSALLWKCGFPRCPNSTSLPPVTALPIPCSPLSSSAQNRFSTLKNRFVRRTQCQTTKYPPGSKQHQLLKHVPHVCRYMLHDVITRQRKSRRRYRLRIRFPKRLRA